MCTIVIKTFPQIPAIPLPPNMEDLHNPNGISQDICVSVICCPGSMHTLSMSFASTMPAWTKSKFFDPENERKRLHVHKYASSQHTRDIRGMENLHLLEIKELPLKSLENFKSALNCITNRRLKGYVRTYVVLMPGDWPAQFYIQQAVYRSLYPSARAKPTDHPIADIGHDHDYYTTHIPHSTSHVTGTIWTEEVQSIVPLMGPLHISLNACEDICEIYHPFMKHIYQQLFPGCQLAKKPKPWRTTLLLEIIYGGWTLIRASAIASFSNCKLMQFGIVLNLLDNYLPLVLIIYAISLRYCFVGHWAKNNTKLYKTLQENISCTDEYPVENAHSQTNSSDDCETISQKAKMIYTSKAEI